MGPSRSIAHRTLTRLRARAMRVGAHHGLFCVGCCWSLMLLMFAIGAGSLGWMLMLGAVMAVEKNMLRVASGFRNGWLTGTTAAGFESRLLGIWAETRRLATV